MTKKILTGLQSTADQFHIGNYFGAIAPLFALAKEHPDAEVFLMIANMHALTSLHDADVLRNNILQCFKFYLAAIDSAWLDRKQFVIYNPARIPAHAQATRIFQCLTNMWTMERMHSYKDALAKGKGGEVGVGVFCYPVLQAADILLYDADIVPVGKDQKQHLEYARDIANKFNHMFWETLTVPQPKIQEEVAVIPGLDGRKMSKSYNNYIGMMDDPKTLKKKVRQIPTSMVAVEDPKDPDTCNVYNMIKLFLSEEEKTALRKRYTDGGLSYKDVKDELYEKLLAFLTPIQERFAEISDSEVQDVVDQWVEYAGAIAKAKIEHLQDKVGLTL